MESAGKQIEDDVLRQQLKGKGLGTVATRPAIIENLLQRGYIRQEQKTLRPTEKGSQLISLIQNRLPHAALLISAEMTGQLEYDLAQVEKGELALEKYMSEVEEAVIRIINELRAYEQKYGKTPLAQAPARSARSAESGKSSKKVDTSSEDQSDKSVKKQRVPKKKMVLRQPGKADLKNWVPVRGAGKVSLKAIKVTAAPTGKAAVDLWSGKHRFAVKHLARPR